MTTTATTAIQQEKPLRKRMRVLERAHSFSSLNADVLPEVKLKHKDSGDEPPSSPLTEYESHSESSDEENSTGEEDQSPEQVKPRRPTVDTTPRHSATREHSPISPKSRAWYEFDLAVVVALVSPIGNWLTGGDHIKNLFLIFLLIFYLHQIIEIPWSLYQKSRARTRAAHLLAYAEPDSSEARYSQLAASELQKFEFFFLFLTFVSPILGAALLRYASDAILGPDAVSWFSTGFFVLATGMRPWAHLVDRLNQRTTELHDFVHYPSSSQGIAHEEHKALEKRVAHLERAFGKMKAKVANTTEDVFEYVDDAVEAVEHAMRKQERKWDRYEGKVKEVEQVVVQLSNTGRPENRGMFSANISNLKAYLSSILDHTVPAWIVSLIRQKQLYPDIYSSTSAIGNDQGTLSPAMQLSAVGSKARKAPLSGHSTPSSPRTPLETIFEEQSPLYMQAPTKRSLSLLFRPYYLATGLVYEVGYLMTAPLRVVGRMVARNYD